ncbi:MAG: hypothetical protein FJ082_13890 [Cyanobacteria bacterium K_Offshore_surface_m2_011]|nr:hypothetical protein [Cyanobacteria bacterium K_Offshore_surface_m2_011]
MAILRRNLRLKAKAVAAPSTGRGPGTGSPGALGGLLGRPPTLSLELEAARTEMGGQMEQDQAEQGQGCGFNGDLCTGQLPDGIQQLRRQDGDQDGYQVDPEQHHGHQGQAIGDDSGLQAPGGWVLAHGWVGCCFGRGKVTGESGGAPAIVGRSLLPQQVQSPRIPERETWLASRLKVKRWL